MSVTRATMALTVATIVTGWMAAGLTSPSITVDTSPLHNRNWMTLYTNEMPLTWEWQTPATRAELDITGMSGAIMTNFTVVTTNWIWRPFSGSVPNEEDVYDLTLTFWNGDAIVGALTSRLAVVAGAFGAIVIDPGPENRKWQKIGNRAVIPYDSKWTNTIVNATGSSLAIAKQDGAAQTNEFSNLSGYYGWDLRQGGWGYGVFNLMLSFSITTPEWNASLI
ncbi:MAG: hypothetical protein PHU80_05475, partial [Kiritimatiellae bacterium]|nr:hypothetical protein [Kiritimatiellia bacterium]